MRPTARWLVPVAVAATIVGGTAVSSAMAGSTPALPQRTPEQVLAAVAASTVTTLSGTVVTHAELGLPGLPSTGGQSSHGGQARDSAAGPQALVTRFLAGDNTVRVWIDGPQRQRAQLVDQFADLDVVHDGDHLWTYDSRTDTVQHTVLTADRKGTSTPGEPGNGPQDLRSLTPDQLARRVLAAVDPTTSVSLDRSAQVARQDTYTLRLTPRTTGTLVDHVLIAVDAGTGLPLRVTVYARGHADPVLESGFTSVDFARPASSVFSFTPPRSATVKQVPWPSGPAPSGTRHPPGHPAPSQRPTVIGTGWTTIVELSGSPSPSSSPSSSPSTSPDAVTADPKAADLVRQLTAPVAGGRALRTALVSVLLTDDGRVLAGAVPLQALQDAAARR